jgi:predicted metal-dependent peptidase
VHWVRVNDRQRLKPEEWAWLFARVRLHIGMNHIDPRRTDLAWHAACWVEAELMMAPLNGGRRPERLPPVPGGLPRGEAALAMHLAQLAAIPADIAALSLGAPLEPFCQCEPGVELTTADRSSNTADLAEGIRTSAREAVSGHRLDGAKAETVWSRARAWAIEHYPLVGALASAFTMVDDKAACQRMNISVAAICDSLREIYVNPDVKVSDPEARFIMVHELMHAGLRHTPRCQGRDPWLWNIACDYVINGWLIEMQVGRPPDQLGYMQDPELDGLSAEEVYDRIVRDLRWMRRLKKASTMNGTRPDMLDGGHPPGWWSGGGMSLDAFYRQALAHGLDHHQTTGRGLLPAGLVEEIRAQSQPPIPWDVRLGHWLDSFFPALESRRTFARASRRQASTPDIVRPAWQRPQDMEKTRVLVAVVDTSGSMDRAVLAKGIGAIASYALSRDVRYVRLICCDAAAHDMGYVTPERLLEAIELRGRGGTVLMPAIQMIERAHDIPREAPVLIVTDGDCDTLTVRRDHAYLMPGGRLPFTPQGPVFHMQH